jgi:hypothetical protein
MTRKSITQDLHGTEWKVHRNLADSPGLKFAQDYFSGYDWSQVEWVTIKVGAWGGPGPIYDEEFGGGPLLLAVGVSSFARPTSEVDSTV